MLAVVRAVYERDSELYGLSVKTASPKQWLASCRRRCGM